jgi:hypothetical protein
MTTLKKTPARRPSPSETAALIGGMVIGLDVLFAFACFILGLWLQDGRWGLTGIIAVFFAFPLVLGTYCASLVLED